MAEADTQRQRLAEMRARRVAVARCLAEQAGEVVAIGAAPRALGRDHGARVLQGSLALPARQRSPIERSEFTVLIYLNDDFEGGATDFLDRPSVIPVSGTALIFAHAQLHQGAPPTRGHKYVLRTDIMYRYDRTHGRDSANAAGGHSDSLT